VGARLHHGQHRGRGGYPLAVPSGRPGADCFVFDHRVVRWNFQRGDSTNPRHYAFSSDPRTIRDVVAAFELAWNRATPHADYKPD
jgi:Family of unknown function (DUF6879)